MTLDSLRPGRRVLARRARLAILVLLVASVAGCGPATDDQKLPDEAKKALVRKKVDVQPRPSKKATPSR